MLKFNWMLYVPVMLASLAFVAAYILKRKQLGVDTIAGTTGALAVHLICVLTNAMLMARGSNVIVTAAAVLLIIGLVLSGALAWHLLRLLRQTRNQKNTASKTSRKSNGTTSPNEKPFWRRKGQ